jgi:hypothetical protein
LEKAVAWLGVIVGLLLIIFIFVDAFEVMLLPRRVRHSYRLARMFYRSAWLCWRRAAQLYPAGRWRNGFLSVFGPLSLFGLLCLWAGGLVVGFALIHWSLRTARAASGEFDDSLGAFVYFSGSTFFTLGYGDLNPVGVIGRTLAVLEAGIGFGFLAVVISYLPVLYQAFSRREITISLLDARAGSPPTAGELLRRLVEAGKLPHIGSLLVEWEQWSGQLLESHISFPVLSYYRSQHNNQSWIGALTTILDTSAFLIAGIEGIDKYQARVTFAMARHAAVDLGLVFHARPLAPEQDRLPPADLSALRESLRGAGVTVHDSPAAARALAELRQLYEPFVNALAAYFEFSMPPFRPSARPVDNWQTSPWTERSPGLESLPTGGAADEHL